MDTPKLSDNVAIDDEEDVIAIYGKKYSGNLFRGLGFTIREDEYFQIIKRDDDVITISVTRKPPFRVEED